MKPDPMFMPKTLAPTAGDARGTDAGEIARVFDRMEELTTARSEDAKAVTTTMQAATEDAAAEAAVVDQINAEARAIEMDNHARLTRLLLREAGWAAGAYVAGRLLFGNRATQPRKDRGK